MFFCHPALVSGLADVSSTPAELLLVPITVFSISSWTRFLTPGSGLSSPDLGCSISFTTSPVLSMYIVHTDETFRITVPIDSSAISNLHTTANHAINVDALAVRFDLAPGSAVYPSWMERDGECWRVVGDFTSGDAGRGGRCELTGDREVGNSHPDDSLYADTL